MNLYTIVNLIVVGVTILFLWQGYRQGFVLKLLSILSFFVLGFLSWELSGIVSRYIQLYPTQDTIVPSAIVEGMLQQTLNRLTFFVILFVIFQLVLCFIRPMLHILDHIPVVSILNRITGACLGGIQIVFILCLCAVILRLPFISKGNDIVEHSYLRHYEQITKMALFYINEPVVELQRLNQPQEEERSFTQEEFNAIQAWLQQSMDKESVDAILSHLRVE